MTTVCFACVHNAGRSQMAAAFFGEIANPDRARAVSAGTAPSDSINPVVAEVMAELGFDLKGAIPRRLTAELAGQVDMLVTMGCGEQCPVVAGLTVIDWPLNDPKGKSVEAVRVVRDGVRARVMAMVDEHGWRRA